MVKIKPMVKVRDMVTNKVKIRTMVTIMFKVRNRGLGSY